MRLHVLDGLRAQAPILLVEQNFRFASKIADRFYVVDHGKVIDRFTVGELPGRMTMLNEALGV